MPVSELVISNTVAIDTHVEDTIRAQEFPLSDRARRHLDDLIEAVVAMFKHAVLRQKREERAQAQATLAQAQGQLAAHAPQLAAAEGHHASCPSGSWVLAALMTPFFLACLGMEFVLSWVTLPLLFGVDRYSALGIMLGVGPTGAVAVLKIFIARLVEDPYHSSMRASGKRRIGILAVMVVFAITLTAFNIQMLVLQADVREAVAQAAHALRTETVTAPYEPVDSHDAVVAVSVAAAVDGAIFFLVAWNEARLWRRRRTAHGALEHARARARELEAAVAIAQATLAVRLQEDIDEVALVASNRRRAELQSLCDKEESRQEQARPSEAAISRRLRVLEAV